MGPNLSFLKKPKTEKITMFGEHQGSISFKYTASEMQGWRYNMEDAHITNPNLDPNIGLFAIFDGHGGIECAKFCERNFEEVLKLQKEYKTGENLGKALENTFLGLDSILMTKQGQDALDEIKKEYPDNACPVERTLKLRGIKGARLEKLKKQYGCGSENVGCTANVLMIHNNTLICANAGDSRCVIGEAGKAIPLSKDHKPTQQRERQRIVKAGSRIMEGRVDGNLNLSRAIGDISMKMRPKLTLQEQAITSFPDIKTYQINDKTDFVVMGCDGIWEMRNCQQMVNEIYKQMKKHQKISKVAEAILDMSCSPNINQTQGLGCDNMSIIIIDFRKDNVVESN